MQNKIFKIVILTLFLSFFVTQAACINITKTQPVESENISEMTSEARSDSNQNKIVVGIDREPISLLDIFSNYPDWQFSGLIYQGLFSWNSDCEIIPEIAVDVPTVENGGISSDYKKVIIEIKPEAVWSDGKPITSKDIVFTWQAIINNTQSTELTNFFIQNYKNIESIETPNEKAIIINFKERYHTSIDRFFQFVLPEHVLKDKSFSLLGNQSEDNLGSSGTLEIIVGSGPYVLKEWEAGNHITLVRNKNYWKETKPTIESLEFVINENMAEMAQKMKAGEIDVALLPRGSYKIEKSDYGDDTQIILMSGASFEKIGFSKKGNKYVRDADFRKALCFAINRQAISEKFSGGATASEVLQSFLISSDKYYEPAWDIYEYNPDKAKEYLIKSNYQVNPETIYLSTDSGSNFRVEMEQMVKADLEKIGVKVELKNFDPDVWYSENLRKGEFDLAIFGWAPYIGEKDKGISLMFKSTSIFPNGENYYQYKNTGVDSMIEELNSSNQDPKELFLKIQQAIANDAILLPLYQYVYGIMIARNNIAGIKNNPCLVKPFWNIEEWSISE